MEIKHTKWKTKTSENENLCENIKNVKYFESNTKKGVERLAIDFSPSKEIHNSTKV